MNNILLKNKARFDKSIDLIRKVYNHEKTDRIPFIVADVNYWIDGENTETIPKDYFTNPEIMTNYQLGKIATHLERYDDDYVPVLFPWYGTGVVPSALGCSIKFHDYTDPSVGSKVLENPEDIRNLKKPDPYKDGLMPIVLKTIDYMKENSDLPISFTDPQGPLNIAICLCGIENLFIWMYEEPECVHEIMEFCTEVFIDWINVQKKHIGQRISANAFPHGIVLPEEFGGIWISDDDCTVISSELYKEFVVPYNSKVFKAFGGGTIHFCGSAEHQIENFLKTEGCNGVNNFCMGNFSQIYKMQEAYKGKMVLMVCDFAPLDAEEYFNDLFSKLSREGVIIGSFPTAEFALTGMKYEKVSRDKAISSDKMYKVLNEKCN